MIRCTAREPVRNAHSSTNAMRLRWIMGGPITPLKPEKAGLVAAFIERMFTWK